MIKYFLKCTLLLEFTHRIFDFIRGGGGEDPNSQGILRFYTDDAPGFQMYAYFGESLIYPSKTNLL